MEKKILSALRYNVVGFRSSDINLKLKGGDYVLSRSLLKKIRIKNGLLFLVSFPLNFLYLYSIERYRNIPLDQADPSDLVRGIGLGLGLVVFQMALVYFFSRLVIREEDLDQVRRKEDQVG